MEQNIFTNKDIIKRYNSNDFRLIGQHYNLYNGYNSADNKKLLELVEIIDNWLKVEENVVKQAETGDITESTDKKSTNVEETASFNISSSDNNFVKDENEPETITDVITRIPDENNINNYDEIRDEICEPVTVMGVIREMLQPIKTDNVENFWKTFDKN